MLVAFQRIAADEFGEAVGLMGVGGAHRAHFVEDNADAAVSQLPCGFGTGEAAAGDYDAGLQVLF